MLPSCSRAIALGLALLVVPACGGDDTAAVDYCETVRGFEAQSDTFSALFEADDPDPKDVETAYRAIGAQIDALAAHPPAEIEAEVTAMAGAMHQLITLFERNNWDLASVYQSDDLGAFLDLMDSDAISGAQERLEQYSEETCGIGTGS